MFPHIPQLILLSWLEQCEYYFLLKEITAIALFWDWTRITGTSQTTRPLLPHKPLSSYCMPKSNTVCAYNLFFNSITIVCDDNHTSKYCWRINTMMYWGIFIYAGRFNCSKWIRPVLVLGYTLLACFRLALGRLLSELSFRVSAQAGLISCMDLHAVGHR